MAQSAFGSSRMEREARRPCSQSRSGQHGLRQSLHAVTVLVLQVVAEHEVMDGLHLAAAGLGCSFRGAEVGVPAEGLNRFVEID